MPEFPAFIRPCWHIETFGDMVQKKSLSQSSLGGCSAGCATPRDLAEAAMRAVWNVHPGEGLINGAQLAAALTTIDLQQSCQVLCLMPAACFSPH